jgi:hypothetical protein
MQESRRAARPAEVAGRAVNHATPARPAEKQGIFCLDERQVDFAAWNWPSCASERPLKLARESKLMAGNNKTANPRNLIGLSCGSRGTLTQHRGAAERDVAHRLRGSP